MEDFPLVPGIAKIEDRMGFNSSFHLLCAFFSMREWYEGGLYDVNGFLLVVCCSYFLTGPDRLLRKERNDRLTFFHVPNADITGMIHRGQQPIIR